MRQLLIFFLLTFLFSFHIKGQSDADKSSANVFTGGLFMESGKWEIKLYNNLFTQIKPQFSGPNRRSSFNSSFLQLTIGSDHNVNYGMDLIYKSNLINDSGNSSPFSVFQFMTGMQNHSIEGYEFESTSTHGLTHFGPRIRTKPFKNKHFTLQQAVYVPTGNLNEGWIINTDLFYETVIDNKFMLFGNIGAWYPLSGDIFPYARLFAGTLLAKRIGPFVMINLPYELGLGTKVFITPKLELEFMYTKWLPVEAIVENRRPTTINFGIRLTNFNNF